MTILTSEPERNASIETRRPRPAHFRRYTSLGAVIHMLQTKQITLLNPASWDDKNDAHFMAEYKRKKGFETVLALCIAQTSETYHHWRVFADGPDGVCIEFDRDPIIEGLLAHEGVTGGAVEYRKIADVRTAKAVQLNDLPFIKRYPYSGEREYRFVYCNETDAKPAANFPISLGWIRRITLSPWMAPVFRDSIKTTLKSISGCEKLKVFRSTLVGNSEWQAVTNRVT